MTQLRFGVANNARLHDWIGVVVQEIVGVKKSAYLLSIRHRCFPTAGPGRLRVHADGRRLERAARGVHLGAAGAGQVWEGVRRRADR